MKHTPGPWAINQITENGLSRAIRVSEERYGDTVADVRDLDDGKQIQTARLIAAAPELWALVKRCIEPKQPGDSPELWFIDAQSVISKIEGRD